MRCAVRWMPALALLYDGVQGKGGKADERKKGVWNVLPRFLGE